MFRTGRRTGLILEIQAASIDESTSSASLLAKAKIAASKLGLKGTVDWVESEINGYNCLYDELPDYRKAHGALHLKNPYHGLIPYIIKDETAEELITRTPIVQSVGEIESLIKSKASDGIFQYTLSNKARGILIDWQEKSQGFALEPVLLLNDASLTRVVQKTRSLVLDWALKLEEQGIMGEDMTFSNEEKKRAVPVTQNVFAQNIGVIGNVSDSASVLNTQSAKGQKIDLDLLSEFIKESRQQVPLLPSDLRAPVAEKIEEIESSKTDGKRRLALLSLRSILEGATGSIAAQGIIQAISGIL